MILRITLLQRRIKYNRYIYNKKRTVFLYISRIFLVNKKKYIYRYSNYMYLYTNTCVVHYSNVFVLYDVLLSLLRAHVKI